MKIRTVAQLGIMCLVTLMMVCADAQAQPGGGRGGRGGGGRGGFGRGGGALAFIQRNDVQTELNLSEAQKGQIETIADELSQGGGGRGQFGNFADMSDEERQEALAQFRDERQKQQDDALAKAKDVLNANQATRYGELELQYALQQMKDSDQMKVLVAYLDNAKIESATGAPFEFEQQAFGGFGGGRGGGGGRGAGGRGGGGRGGRGGGAGAGGDAGGAAPSRRDRGDE